ncbi:AAA family ATPase [Deinococcus pimensis]|uniref:AAA family ATPase n=1 Tax=Deinococcus pimensis TaxID=309888 RepID=UPI000486BBC1|nr:AAA family ATPase [Deinococcus pimensis]
MKRVLITGMSGAGKSSVVVELLRRGRRAVDLDSDEWSEWTRAPRTGDASGTPERPDWAWRLERVRALLAEDRGEAIFVSGCASNQGLVYDLLDHVVLLNAPLDVLLDRVTSRTTNTYGRTEAERADIAHYVEHVVPLLRVRATRELDTSTLTVEEVADRLVELARS